MLINKYMHSKVGRIRQNIKYESETTNVVHTTYALSK